MSEETLDSGSVDPNQLELGLDFPNDPSYWNYRVVKVPIEDGDYIYGIYEVQYNVEGEMVKYSDFPIELFADIIRKLFFLKRLIVSFSIFRSALLPT